MKELGLQLNKRELVKGIISWKVRKSGRIITIFCFPSGLSDFRIFGLPVFHTLPHVSTDTNASKFRIPIFFSVINPSAYFTPMRLPNILARAITLSRKSGVEIYV